MKLQQINPQRWKQIDDVFQQALVLEQDEREPFLKRVCNGDEELRRELESLLAEADQTNGFLATPPAKFHHEQADDSVFNSFAGRRVGAYRLLHEIGRGGMGAVYLAERADEEFSKQVAVKLIKRGMDTDEIISRFRHERQILAQLDHPNIARMYDGGTTTDGLPYFVMEHIAGLPIDEYCRAHQLNTNARLKLLLKVCAAVQYAHQNLVVHRDLKPGNILVTEENEVKLLDFGIAKLLDPAAARVTATELRPMTLEYASPEQIKGEAITTATDVWSLGVVLYELLTGQHPFRVQATTRQELTEAICERELERPSLTARHQPSQRLSSDLDNIVLMALRKEPTRRYASVEQLSEDIRHFLTGLPVMAKEDTWRYRTSKFVWRNRKLVLAAAMIFFALLAGIIATTWQARIARSERDKAQQVSAFLVSLFEVPDPIESKASTLTTREVLDKGAEKIERELKDQPETQATLLHTMGQVYGNLGSSSRAIALLDAGLKLRQQLYGDDHPETAATKVLLAWRLKGKNDQRAEALFQSALTTQQRHLNNDDPAIAKTMVRYGAFFTTLRRFSEAESLLLEGLSRQRRILGNLHQEVAFTLSALFILKLEQGKAADGEGFARDGLKINMALFGEDHFKVANARHNLGLALEAKKEYPEAEMLLRQALLIFRKSLSETHEFVATSAAVTGVVVLKNNKPAEAEPLIREGLQIRQKILPPNHWTISASECDLGYCLTKLRRFQKAEPLLTTSYQKLKKEFGADNWRVKEANARLIEMYEVWGKPDMANGYRTPQLS